MEDPKNRSRHLRGSASCKSGMYFPFLQQLFLANATVKFVDPLILMRVVRNEAKRRIVFLIAEKSIHRPFIGAMARAIGAVPVGRALDSTKSMPGKIYLPDPDNDPLHVRGNGTNFKAPDFQVGGLLVLPTVNHAAANAEIAEIVSEDEIRLKKPFKGSVGVSQLTGKGFVVPDGQTEEEVKKRMQDEEFKGTPFKVAPKIDQTKVYDAVFEKLSDGGCIGMFPEGGSHDRTELLPIKAGVAIMALGALAADPNCGLKVIPCGMNYFHAHKFRSRAVVEFGTPVDVPPELVERYKKGERREAISQLLDAIYDALVAVTVTSPDYDTLMVGSDSMHRSTFEGSNTIQLIQAVRRLYNPKGKKLPLPMVVELNRRLVKGYARYKDDPRIIKLKKAVLDYNRRLLALNIRDHQVEYAKLPVIKVLGTFIYRFTKLVLLSIGTLPGLILFAPVFIAGKVISRKKAKEALAASTVKIQARDVMATWKLLVAMALAPTLCTFYNILLASWTYYNRIQGYVPEWVPLWLVFVFGYILFPAITYAALRFGEIGMDIFKSLWPLLLALSPQQSNVLISLRQRRSELAHEVTDLINTLGPEMFPDFEHSRIIHDPNQDHDAPRSPTKIRAEEEASGDYTASNEPTSPLSPGFKGFSAFGHGHRNESFANISNVGIFASRPGTPHHHRSRSRASSTGGGFPILGFSSLDSKEGFDEVTKKIRGAMRERSQRRKSETENWESGYSTPTSEGPDGLSITMSSKENKKDA